MSGQGCTTLLDERSSRRGRSRGFWTTFEMYGDTRISSDFIVRLLNYVDDICKEVCRIAGGLQFLKSRKGHPVLIHNGHMYTLSHKADNRSMWVCVKQRLLNCGGCVTTANATTLLSYSGHNHAQLNDVIQRLQASSCSPSPELI